MSEEDSLPDEAINAVKAGRKLEAIKCLREARGIGLKEAKRLVDAYMDDNPSAVASPAVRSDTGIGRIVLLIAGVFLIFGIYRYFS